MKYLLIDFGATYIKCAYYDGAAIVPTFNQNSPFEHNSTITRCELLGILTNIVEEHDAVDGIIICTILGGIWDGDIYKSWKNTNYGRMDSYCMISGLFKSQIIHIDHMDYTNAEKYVSSLEIVGYIHQTPVYSSMGDTNCVIRSLNMKDDVVYINIGTGSQLITNNSIKRYFPAGRSFLVFNRLFEFSDLSLFDIIGTLTLADVVNSDIDINLAVFPQSRNWQFGGSINRITEDTFTIKNLVSSMLKSLVIQYKDDIGDFTHIELVGGMVNKIKILPDVFRYIYSDKTIIYNKSEIEATHIGMSIMVDKYLKDL